MGKEHGDKFGGKECRVVCPGCKSEMIVHTLTLSGNFSGYCRECRPNKDNQLPGEDRIIEEFIPSDTDLEFEEDEEFDDVPEPGTKSKKKVIYQSNSKKGKKGRRG